MAEMNKSFFNNPLIKIINACLIGGIWGYTALIYTKSIIKASSVVIILSGLYMFYYYIVDLTQKVYANISKIGKDYNTVNELYKDVVFLGRAYKLLNLITFKIMFNNYIKDMETIKQTLENILNHKKK